MSDRLRVLGVDPGSRRTGWGLLGGSARRPELIDSGVIRLPAARSFAERLAHLQQAIDALAGRLEPDIAAVESSFHGISARASIQLAHARGVVLAALAARGVEIVEYTPATVKKSVAGDGRADKERIRIMVERLLRSADPAVPAGRERGDDRTDALAVALCHAAHDGHRAALRRAGLR